MVKKLSILTTAVVALVALCLTSCSKDDDEFFEGQTRITTLHYTNNNHFHNNDATLYKCSVMLDIEELWVYNNGAWKPQSLSYGRCSVRLNSVRASWENATLSMKIDDLYYASNIHLGEEASVGIKDLSPDSVYSVDFELKDGGVIAGSNFYLYKGILYKGNPTEL